ncbi:MAG: HlyD family efflux transporter periplasmic adaptor subunit [Oligoflexia bacterium]|nr:HlyD family efflux transporter periplasmic adaptor subunit [Oligoflexia bacterium]
MNIEKKEDEKEEKKPSFFREEVIQNQSEIWGGIIVNHPPRYALYTGVSFFTILGIILFIVLGEYSRKEQAIGYLVPDKGLVRVYSSQSGVLTKISIKEGDIVKKNAPIASVVMEQANSTGHQVGKLMLSEVTREIEFLEDRIDSAKKNLQTTLEQTNEKITGLTREIENLNQQQKLVKNQVVIAENGVKKIKPFLGTSVSKVTFEEKTNIYLATKVQLSNIEYQIISKQNELKQTIASKNLTLTEGNSRILELQSSLSNLKQKHLTSEGNYTTTVIAPIDGKISAIQIKEGQYVNTNAPLFTIIPIDAKLQAELFVPTRAIGLVEVGQEVKIKYDAFPYQKYGIYSGIISELTKTVLLPGELNFPPNTTEPVYRLIVKLKDSTVSAYGKKIPLQVGMSLHAIILFDKRSIFEWVMDPIYSMRGTL